MLNWKATIALLIVRLIKKTWYKWMSIFLELKSSGGRVKVELDLSNYATKADLKIATGDDISKC